MRATVNLRDTARASYEKYSIFRGRYCPILD